MTPRGGTTLAEMVVALALAGVLMGAAARGVTQHLRWQRDRAEWQQGDDAARQAVAVLRSEVERADGTVTVLGDTAVQLSAVRVVAVACDTGASRLVVPASVAAWSAPRIGDSLAMADTALGEWRTSIVAASSLHSSTRCPAGGTRVTLAAPLAPSALPLLLPARVWRVARYMIYRAGDGSWWLGERSCAPACTSAQPVAGPLATPAQGGLRLSLVVSSDGRPLALDIQARAPVRGRVASASARVPLRAITR